MKARKTGLLRSIAFTLGLTNVRLPAPTPFSNIGHGHGHLTVISPIDGAQFNIYGGSYYDAPPMASVCAMASVRLEKSIKRNEDDPLRIDFPIRDFSVPTMSDLLVNLNKALELGSKVGNIYVGCMGGYGRTGTFIAALLMVCNDIKADEAIELARVHIHGHCVETESQVELLHTLESWLMKSEGFEELLEELAEFGEEYING